MVGERDLDLAFASGEHEVGHEVGMMGERDLNLAFELSYSGEPEVGMMGERDLDLDLASGSL